MFLCCSVVLLFWCTVVLLLWFIVSLVLWFVVVIVVRRHRRRSCGMAFTLLMVFTFAGGGSHVGHPIIGGAEYMPLGHAIFDGGHNL
jgi:hypothetical protein